jgi:surface protein
MVETTPFNGMAANAAYAYETEAERVESGLVGSAAKWSFYDDGTFVLSGGSVAGDVLAETIHGLGDVTDIVFEDTPTITGSLDGTFNSMDLVSVSGELVYEGSLSDTFGGCYYLQKVDLTFAEGSNVTDMSYMFMDCENLTEVSISGWDYLPVEDMTSMFEGCSALESVNTSAWKTGSVTDMTSMFEDCEGIAKLDLASWDVSGVESMNSMFWGCTSLEEIVMTGWDTGSVEDMAYMFGYCSSLAKLEVSGFDMSNVGDLMQMFYNCSTLKSLDLSSWDLSSAYQTSSMFAGCTSLATIDFSGWDASGVTYASSMFEGAENVTCLVLDDVDDINFLEGLVTSESWVFANDSVPGEFTMAELIAGWKPETMAGTWYTVSALPAPVVTPVAVYRLYNPNSGEHFYTLSEVERDATVAAGWNDEGIGWYAPDTSDKPVYRLYSGTDHHYTMDEEEKDALIAEGWKYEGVAFYSAEPEDGIALLRQFNPNVDPEAATNNSGSHNYTTDQVENDYLVSLGWQAEDVAFYGMVVDKDDASEQPGNQEEDVTPAPPAEGEEV